LTYSRNSGRKMIGKRVFVRRKNPAPDRQNKGKLSDKEYDIGVSLKSVFV
jgi:hypothetical protein